MKKCLDGRKVNDQLFKVAQRRVTAAGYYRSEVNIRWKVLKCAYCKCIRPCSAPIMIQGGWRYEMNIIAPWCPLAVVHDINKEVKEDSDEEESNLHWPQAEPFSKEYKSDFWK